ncbi:MAG TPA: type II CAAX endopeptidase family protein [Rhizomicrobium sp.]|nr:type II CAAX endopeptidase family protein [Rhizomicrobium sp.]
MLHAFLARHTVLDFVLLFLAAILMPVLSAVTGRQLALQSGVPLMRRYWLTVFRGWLVVALVLFAWLWAKRPFDTLGLDWPIDFWGRVGFVAVTLVALVFCVQIARLPKIAGRNLDRWAQRMEELKITPRTRNELLLFVLVAITAGVWEELLYRGFFIWFLVPVTGVIGAVAISSLIFGIGHIYQGRYGVVNTGLVGLAFAILYLLSQSLWWLMAAHAVVDIYGGALAYRVMHMRDAAVKYS